MRNILKDRLLQLIEEQSHSARSLSLKAGHGPTYISDFLTGKKETIRPKKLAAIAAVLGVTVDYLNGLTEDRQGEAIERLPTGINENPSYREIPIFGNVCAGAWLEVGAKLAANNATAVLPADLKDVSSPRAFTVANHDASCLGLPVGKTVVFASQGEPRADGALFVVRRSMGGKAFELSIRRFDAGKLAPTSTVGDQEPVAGADCEVLGAIVGYQITQRP